MGGRHIALGLLAFGVAASACVPPPEDDNRYDLRPRDPGVVWPDAGGAGPDADAPRPDAAPLDVGAPDAGRLDATEPPPDAGFADADTPDTGARDADAPDMGFEDAAAPDAAGPNDAGAPLDAGSNPVNGTRTQTPFGKRHIYSQLQAWSYDGIYFLTVDTVTSEAVVYHAVTWQEQARLQRIGHRWVTGTHQVLMFEDNAGGGAELYSYNLDTGVESRVMSLGHPGLRAGRSHEEMDRDGRWVAAYIDQPSGGGGERIVTADTWTRTIGADVSIGSLGCSFEPDWVGVDPTGNYLLVQSVQDGNGTCRGLWAHDIRTGAAVRQITPHHNHGTTGLGPTGRPYFLSTEQTHPNDNNNPGIYRYWIDTGMSAAVGISLPWGALEHISCLAGPGEPCLASASNQFSTAYTGQIWRLDFSGARTILEPHNANGCGYWGQPQVTVGPGGRYAFATHGGNCAQIRDQVVQ